MVPGDCRRLFLKLFNLRGAQFGMAHVDFINVADGIVKITISIRTSHGES